MSVFRRIAWNTEQPVMMGILNVTPDSFSDGGCYTSLSSAMLQAETLVYHGAQVLDIGGESSRPYAHSISAEQELQRVLPVVKAVIAQNWPIAISIDTCKAVVARACLEAGAEIINDVSSFGDAQMAATVAQHRAHIVLMHRQGTALTMQQNPTYSDPVAEIGDYLLERANYAQQAGIGKERIWIDPGIGFGKTLAHNCLLIQALPQLQALGLPVVLGVSRKHFLGELLHITEPQQRDVPTALLCMLAFSYGIRIVRVHHAALAAQAIQLFQACRNDLTNQSLICE